MNQSKISKTQDAVFILGTLIRFQRNDDGLCWTRQMLSEHTGMHPDRCHAALVWLIKMRFIWYGDDEYGATGDGRAYHKACERKPLMAQVEFAEWRAEALSGMDANGRETTIEGAVIPK